MKVLRAILFAGMSMVVLLSSIGFSVSRHYCLGMLAEESFYHLGNESCGMLSSDCASTEESLDAHCCENQNLSIPGIQIQDRLDDNKDLIDQEQAIVFSNNTFNSRLIIFSPEIHSRLANAPPENSLPRGKDLLIQNQRFLI